MAGAGFSGIVYKAQHIRLNELRAIKCVEKNRPYYQQLSKEVLILKNLKHPAIPIIYDIEEDEACLYLVEEYIAGVSLQELISKNETFPTKTILQYAIQLCDVIQYLHTCFEEPILYMDLKPANILVTEDGIRLIDFGSCRIQGRHEEKIVTGTMGYGAPEQFAGISDSEKTDIYGIGAVLYYMITGQRVDGASRKHLSKADISQPLKRLIEACLDSNIRNRPETVAVLKEQLLNLEKPKRRFSFTACNIQKEKDSRILGVLGANRGAGVTHYVLGQGMRYQKQGKKVALVEYNSHNDFGKLKLNDNRKKQKSIEYQGNYESVFHRENDYLTFTLYGIDYYPACNRAALILLQNMDYDHIIIDFGCSLSDSREEFLLCQEKRVLLNADVWHMEETLKLLEEIRKESGSRRWKYLSLFYEENNLMQLEAAYGITIHTLTFGKETNAKRRWYQKRE